MSLKYPQDFWQTPLPITDRVDEFYEGQWFDPCPANPDFDGLAIKWPARTFINPPFSQYLKWAQHGFLQPLEQIWVCHHDSSTERFQTLLPGATICLLYDRISFIHPETGKPKGTDIAKSQTLIYRGNHPKRFAEVFEDIGHVLIEARTADNTVEPGLFKEAAGTIDGLNATVKMLATQLQAAIEGVDKLQHEVDRLKDAPIAPEGYLPPSAVKAIEKEYQRRLNEREERGQ